LGIAGRSITVKFTSNQKEIRCLKPSKNNANSIGGWIQLKRIKRNLTPGHLAAKMGIAAALVCAWEGDLEKPDEQQIKGLAKIFGCDLPFESPVGL
jgi:ribosome-binding protein aMBF1 (putative translation factor)